jgi:RNA polymerase sigma-70 factor (ECF subfamily)
MSGSGRGSEAEARFRLLFGEHFRPLLGYALRRVDSPEDAADVVADTMLVAWRRLGDVPADGTARLWLYGVCRRVLANQRRGRVRRERLGERLRLQLREATADLADEVATTESVRRALAGLNERDRELIMLTSWEGLAPQDLAVVLGLPARTVRTRLHRARSRLRERLGDDFEAGGHVPGVQSADLLREER